MISNLSPQWVKILDTGRLPMLSDPDGVRLALHTFLTEMVMGVDLN